MIFSRLKAIRTNVGRGSRIVAGAAIVGEAREAITVDRSEDVLDGVLVVRIGSTEPGIIPRRAAQAPRHPQKIGVGLAGIVLGVGSGVVDRSLLVRRAADVASPFVVDAGDSEGTGEVDPSNVLNGGVQVFGRAICIDVGEQIRRLDGIVSGPTFSEVVRSRD